ncbi:MAG: sensor histidine kinase KdpD [Faecalibacterium sp.]|jgi:two-component system sensor histidine kinase KdpD|nr:sensor histidine kinase KdpD [Faecalibacterium sp.]
MEDRRADPDELLKTIHNEALSGKSGQLKIFFGYAAGVGKTYAMLKAAHAAKRRGVDVTVGYVEPHPRPQTAKLLTGLEILPTRTILYNGIALKEFDVEKALRRNPQLILVDELAHTNAEGCRNRKRYQDVKELLRAGIDVYTTVNVQHLESLNDMVASITGVTVRERVPDSVFDAAAQVELVDIEPQELIERLNEGKIYKESQAQRALTNFFSVENLTALREIALRRCADRVNRMAESAKVQNNSDYYTDEHILVCLSSSPTNPKIIRTAARMAQAFHAQFTALFVETSSFKSMSGEDIARLRENIHLAQQLGASVETTYGDDIALQIAEYARISGVSKIVLGRYNAVRGHLFSKQTLTEKLIAYAPKLDVYIIPDQPVNGYRPKKAERRNLRLSTGDILCSFGILTAATAIGFLFYHLGFSESNIITIYILGVLLTAVATSDRIYSIGAALTSVLVFNFFFTVPRFSLKAYDPGYPVTFVIMFLAALITGNLAMRIKTQARQSAQSAYRTKVMFDANQELQKADGRDEIISVTAKQLVRLLNRSILFYAKEGSSLCEPQLFACEDFSDEEAYRSDNEKAVAAWVFENNKRAGATTDTLSSAKCLYLAVRMESRVYGVIGVAMDKGALEPFENSVLLSIIGECAMALENDQTAQEKEQAAILAKNEQLRANLLRAISHDLRTPLTSISGNAGVLLANADEIAPAKKQQLYTDIYDDSMWLINLVENLLAVTRIEDGSLSLRLKPELMSDVIDEALHHINRKKSEHHITVVQADELALAKMDARLIVQVVINIVDNAIKYTPPGSEIQIRTCVKNKQVVTEIADNGPGIPDEAKPRIFDMFYTANAKIADSRRSMGLGLALCKSIVTAHGGTLGVSNNSPVGTVFRFTLPVEEVQLHE